LPNAFYKNDAMKNASIILSTLVATILLLVVTISNLPYSAFSINNKLKLYCHSVLPQGWEFFTLNPRSEYLVVYKIENEKLVIEDFRNSALNSFFGISKINRIRNIELEYLISSIDTNQYQYCDNKDSLFTLQNTLPIHYITNNTNIKKLFGEFIIRKTIPIPWAWHNSDKNIFMPSKLIRVKID